jgi:hypothetical protein
MVRDDNKIVDHFGFAEVSEHLLHLRELVLENG